MAAQLADIQRWMNEQQTLNQQQKTTSPIPNRPDAAEDDKSNSKSPGVFHTPLSDSVDFEGTRLKPPTPVKTPLGFKKTGSQRVLADCPGCEDFRCVREWRTIAHAEAAWADDVVEKWCRDHRLLLDPSCDVHGKVGPFRRVGDRWVCCARARSGSDNQCRRSKSCFWPIVNQHNWLTARSVLLFLAHFALGESRQAISKVLDLNPKTVSGLFYRVGRCAYTYLRGADSPRFGRIQVDETFIGRRKDNKGRRARVKGWWFVTVTEVGLQNKAGRTIWTPVAKRNKVTLEALVKKHVIESGRSVVSTDGWKGYVGLSKFCRHRVVDHSKSFVADDGTNTNTSEGLHGVIKAMIKKWMGGGYGRDCKSLFRNVAIACVLYGCGAKEPVAAAFIRLANLLVAVRAGWDANADENNDDMAELPEDSASEDDLDDPGTRTDVRLTAKGKIDRRCHPRTVDDADAPPQKKQRVEGPTRTTPLPKGPLPKETRTPAPQGKSTPAAPPSAPLKGQTGPAKGPPAAGGPPASVAGVSLAELTGQGRYARNITPQAQYPLGKFTHGGWALERLPGEETLADADLLALRRGEHHQALQTGQSTEEANAAAQSTAATGIWTDDNAAILKGLEPGGCICGVALYMVALKLYSTYPQHQRQWKVIDPAAAWNWMHARGSQVVTTAVLRQQIPVNKVVLWPIYYNQHWILMILNREGPRCDVLDSCAGYCCKERGTNVTLVTNLVQRAWGIHIQSTVKQKAPQQDRGSNDCAVFVLRNMRRQMARVLGLDWGAEEGPEWTGLTREWVTRCWVARTEEELPPFEMPQKKSAQKKSALNKSSKKSAAKSVKPERRSTTRGPAS